MAVLSAPSNIPTLDGTTAVCTSDDATGTVYLSVRTDRAWYSVANGDSQGLADADKAVIIAGTVDGNIVFAANQAASLDPEQLIDGLDPVNPYYVGWVQDDSFNDTSVLHAFHTGLDGFAFTRTGEQTGEDHEGNVTTYPADSEAHHGARVAKNEFISPTDLDDPAWTTTGSGSKVGNVVTMVVASDKLLQTVGGVAVGAEICISASFAAGDAGKLVRFSANGGSFAQSVDLEIPAGGGRLSANLSVDGGATGEISTGVAKASGVDEIVYTVVQLQAENVTAKTNKNPSDVIEGIENYATENGNTVDSNGLVTFAGGTLLATMQGIRTEKEMLPLVVHNRDLSQAAWAKTDAPTVVYTASGVDGGLASRITATAATGTVTQVIAGATSDHTYSVDLRLVSGTVEITTDGSSYTDVTSQLNTDRYTRVSLTQAISNVGVRVSGAADVDYAQVEPNPFPTSRVATGATPTARSQPVFSQTLANMGIEEGVNEYSGQISFYWPAHSETALGSATCIFELSDANSSDSWQLQQHQNAGGGLLVRRKVNGGVTTNNGLTVGAFNEGDRCNVRFRFGPDGMDWWVNDRDVVNYADAANMADAVTIVNFGQAANGFANNRKVTIEQFRLMKGLAPDSVIEEWGTEINNNAAIRAELLLPNDESFRPLPLWATWQPGKSFAASDYVDRVNPRWQLDQIEAGNYVYPTLNTLISSTDPDDAYSKDMLEHCKEHNLPISVIIRQPEHKFSDPQGEDGYAGMPESTSPNIVGLDGVVNDGAMDCFPPVPGQWEDVGVEQWEGNQIIKMLEDAGYTNPPMVCRVSNNEHPKQGWSDLETTNKRYVDTYGLSQTDDYKKELVGDQWDALFNAEHVAADASVPAWLSSVTKSIGYYVGGREECGVKENWRYWWQDIPGRLNPYLNCWDGYSGSDMYIRPGLRSEFMTDLSIQSFSQNMAAWRDDALANRPDWWVEMSDWTGSTPKLEQYTNDWGQTLTPQRMAAATAFGLWVLRPRVLRTFGNTGFKADDVPFALEQLKHIKHIHENSNLRRFWRSGVRVVGDGDNPAQFDIPAELAALDRWYQLKASTDPAKPWPSATALDSFNIASVLGNTPNREWLLYSHAPQAYAQAFQVTIPDYKDVTITSAQTGVYWLIDEDANSVTEVLTV